MSPPFDPIAIIGPLGVSLCCGLPLLLFAGITLYAALKHKKNIEEINQAVPLKISTLQQGNRLVRLEGIIRDVPNKIDGPDDSPLAYLRLRVEAREADESGWNPRGDKWRGAPFHLDDGTGTILVNPQGLDKISLGEGKPPESHEKAEAAAILVGLQPVILIGQTRMSMWELRGGQRVTVVGVVQKQAGGLVVCKPPKSPLVVSSLMGTNIQLPTQQQVRTAWIYTAVLGIPGLLGFCCGLGGLGLYIIRYFQGQG